MLFTNYKKNYAKLPKRTLSARKSLAIGLALLLLAVTSWLTLHRDALPGYSRTPMETAAQAVTTAAGVPSAALTASPDETTQRRVNEVYSQLPMSFEVNEGQLDSRVKFHARGSGYQLFLTPTEAVLTLRRNDERGSVRDERRGKDSSLRIARSSVSVVRMNLVGANRVPQVSGQDELPTKTNYFIGDDPQKWRTGVASYAQVRYGEVYPGIDMIYYGRQRQLEYDFVVAPGAEVSAIKLGFAGVQRVRVDAGGDLVLRTVGGEVRQQRPVVYQEVDGERKEIAGRYVLRGEREVGFAVGEYDAGRELVIDPVLLYSTYLGGNSFDYGEGIAVDTAGHIYVTGYTLSTDFPKLNEYQGDPPGHDVFVTKLDTTATGAASLLYSTYLGGNSEDYGHGIAVDTAGHAYVTGSTNSSDFPKLNEYQGDQTRDDVFVTKFDTTAAGAASLLYSTYLGGNRLDFGYDIAVDTAGHAYVTGETSSTDFPKLNEYQGYQSIADVFVTKLDTTAAGSASLLYSTYLSGSGDDVGNGIAVDTAGLAYVTGSTNSSDFPKLNEYQGDQPGYDVFVTKLDTTAAGAASLLYSTYLSGSSHDYGEGIAADTAGHAYVTGYTLSTDFPKLNEYQGDYPDIGPNADVFVTKLDTTATGAASLLYSTYLGGNSDDRGQAIAVDTAGHAYVTGFTYSSNFPKLNEYQGDQRDADVFVTKLDTTAAGTASLLYSTYLGGFVRDFGYDIAVDTAGYAYVVGQTDSTDFPKLNQYQDDQPSYDVFVTKLSTEVANSISGTISYCIDQSKKVPNATVATSSGSPSAMTTTDASGLYQLNNLGVGPYTVAPSKTGAVSGITAFDAALVAQYVAGITTSTSCQTLAGDSSNNGGLSAFDAALIAQTVAGISNPGIAGAWKFVPASRSYPALNGSIPNENYDAVLVGDVSGNWTPAGPEQPIAAPAGGGNVAVSLPNQAAAPGSTNVMVPVFVDNTTGQGIIAYDFTVTFTTSVIQLANPAFETSGTLSAGWNITPNTSTPGQIRIVAFNTTPLAGSGILIFLKFNVVGAQGAMTPLTWTNFVFNEGAPTVSLTNGIFTATAPSVVKLERFAATGYDGGVYLEWKTGLEADNLGFNVYRERVGQRDLVNSETVAGSALLTGQTRLETGRTYSWWDKEIADSQNVQYWLEDIDLGGARTLHGPVRPQQLAAHPPQTSTAALLSQIGRVEAETQPLRFNHQLPTSDAQALKQQELASDAAALKLWVKEEGWYSVTQQELIEAGLDAKADPRRLQMFVDGVEQPILVVGEQDGSFDSIEFYATGQDTTYTNAHVYWLVEGKVAGKRINVVKGAAKAGGAQSFSYTVERKDRTVYFSALRNGEQENFLGRVVSSHPVDEKLTLKHVDSKAQAAELEVALQGVTQRPAAPDHSVRVALNGTVIGRVVFDGREHKVERFSIYQSQLREGDNTVTLEAEGGQGQSDVSLVDYVRLTYQHGYSAEKDELKFTAEASEDGRLQTVDGFSSELIRVIDVTDAGSPEELVGSIERAGNGYQVTVNVGAGTRTLLAFTSQQVKHPSKLAANQPSSLRSESNRADLIVLTRSQYAPTLQPLVNLRRKQGLRVAVIDIEDVFDEFSYGEKSPQAVRDFLQYASASWNKKPRFVLIVGQGSFDPKGYLGLVDADQTATRLIDTQLMETASDDWFVDFNDDGLAELAIGRLPFRSEAEAAVMVAKIVGYEQARPSEEVMLVADSNDGFNFELASAALDGLMPANLRINHINRGTIDGETARRQLLEALNRGQKIVNYIGHGNVDQWRGNLFTSEDARELANPQRLSVFVMMTCLNGYFEDPVLRSLAEELMRSERGGAVAVWASDGMTFPGDQALVNQQLYRLLFAGGGSKVQAMTLGEATQRAKAATAEADVRRTWILFGDPTMKLR